MSNCSSHNLGSSHIWFNQIQRYYSISNPERFCSVMQMLIHLSSLYSYMWSYSSHFLQLIKTLKCCKKSIFSCVFAQFSIHANILKKLFKLFIMWYRPVKHFVFLFLQQYTLFLIIIIWSLIVLEILLCYSDFLYLDKYYFPNV